MTEAAQGSASPPRPAAHPAASYLWRLLLLVPAIALIAVGYWKRTSVPPGGQVSSVLLKSKEGISGQVRDAYAGVMPTTSDFYLSIVRKGGQTQRLETMNDTPLGNGLTWSFDKPISLDEIDRVEVWDDNGILSDKELDRVQIPGDLANAWEIDGQTFHIRFGGNRLRPPDWAGPIIGVGSVLAAVVLLRFVWDQAI